MCPLVRLGVAAAIVSLYACNRTPKPTISESAAKRMVLERYHSLFSDKYLLNSLDGQYYPFPSINPDAFTSFAVDTDTFSLRAEPPSGISLVARVARDGSWTELTRVSVVAE